MQRSKTYRFAIGGAALASALVIAGCSSSDEGSDSAAGSESTGPEITATPEGDVPAADLVLSADELPAGYQVIELPEGSLEETFDQISGAASDATVEPAECTQPEAIPESMDFSEVGMVMASAGDSVLAETVVPGAQNLDDVEETMTGDCADIKLTINAGEAAGATTEASYTELDLPDSAADETFAVRQESTTEVSDQSVETVNLMAFATLDGYTVTVNLSGTDPDEEAFNDLFVRAVDKVAENA